MDYARLPAMVQFALVDVEAHTHLARVEQASRMWRTVAAELRELSDSLRHELDCLRPHWQDATGVGFVHQATRRKAAVDEMLTRIVEHQPWRALDDLARQLLLTRDRITETVERHTDASHEEGAVHLTELDRYFLAAAEAVLAAVGGEHPAVLAAPAWTNDALAGGCCAEPDGMGPTLAGALAPDPALFGTLDPGGGSSLPPGSVSMPGLVAVPPGSLAGRYAPRGAGSGSPAGRAFDPRSVAGGSPPGASAFEPRAALGGSPSDTSGPELPPRIERAANPVPLTESPAVPQAPRPPESPSGTHSGSRGATGYLIPPMMMMPPMVPGTGRSTTGRRSARSLEGSERRTRTTQATPGVPARLRGRSALADPVAGGYRPVAVSGTRNGPKEPEPREALDHEVWQVAHAGTASPLKPEPVEPEPPRRLRRPRP